MSLLDQASLIVTPNGYKGGVTTGKLYSVKPTNGDGDMVVSRGTSATRVDSAGLIEIARTNLALRSEEFNNVLWGKSDAIISADAIFSPIETMTADKLVATAVSSTHYITQQPAGSISGTTYTISVFVKQAELTRIQYVNNALGSGVASYNLSTETATLGSGVSASMQNYGNGWYRCIMTYIPLTTGSFNIQIRLADSSGNTSFLGNGVNGVYLWGFQIEEGLTATSYIPTIASIRTKFAGIIQDGSVAQNIPRLDYTNSTCPSILVEPTRTNLVLYSEQFDNGYWDKFGGGVASAPVVTANVETAPDGTMTADRVVFTLNGGTLGTDISQLGSANFTSTSITRTQSVYIKTTDGTTKVFSFISPIGALTPITITSVYQRFTFTSIGINVSQIRLRLRGSASGEGTATSATIAIWGAQYEDGSTATSYIPTTTIPLTRTDDIITKTGITNLIGQTEGTIFWDVKDLTGSTSTGNPEFMIRNTAFTNWIGITTSTSALPFRVTARPIGGSSIIDYTSAITSAKACLKYGTFGAKLFLNGNPTPVATSVVNPNFSFDNILFRGSIISFKTNRFALWTTALTDAQCISLTT
jgi:hypothetical protein